MESRMRQPFILCGLGKVGWRVLEYLRKTGEPVTVIDTLCKSNDPRLDGATLVSGDCRQAAILQQAGLAEARGVVVLTSDDLVSLSTALMIRHLHPKIRIVVRMFNQSLITRLGPVAENIHALSTSALSSPLLVMIARTGQGFRFAPRNGTIKITSRRETTCRS
jgi:Trk K+ transport system NAD-binding subunit